MNKYRITVSEPWDYESPNGDNIITGVIVKALSSVFIIFKSDYLLNFDEQVGKVLILKTRYENQVLDQEDNYNGTVAGGLLLLDEYAGKDEKYLEEHSKYVLIGSLELV